MKKWTEIIAGIGKDKLLLLAIAGILLLLCSVPDKKEEKKTVQEETTGSTAVSDSYAEELERRLEEIILEIDGVSHVHVMITLKSGESRQVLKDESITSDSSRESDSEGGQREVVSYSRSEDTIFYKNSSGEELPYVVSELSPQIEGVAVVADAGGSIEVKEQIINLIKALFGIEVNKMMVTV